MNCWAVLGIDSTADKKVIKQAYATLLKSNKPDENPKGFATLHAAYKQCLKYSTYMSSASVESVPVSEELENNGHADDSSQTEPQNKVAAENSAPAGSADASDRNLQPSDDEELAQAGSRDDEERYLDYQATAIEEESEEVKALKASWDELNRNTEKALDELKHIDWPKGWEFLEASDALFDFKLKQNYSWNLFDSMLELVEESELDLSLRKESLRYIDEHLHWTDQGYHFEDYYGYDRVAPILNVLAENEIIQERKIQWLSPKVHRKPIEYAGYFTRIFALAVDVLLIYFLVGNTVHDEPVDILMLTFSFYFFAIPIAEASPLQGGLGKILFGIKVTNRKGRRLNILHAFWRQQMYLITMFAIKITIIINLFLSGDRLLHDRLSWSAVIKR